MAEVHEEQASAADAAATADSDSPEALREQIAQLKDKNLRQVAELRNVQQRFEREKEEALRYAESKFARELLVVVDDLERALGAAQAAGAASPVADGLRITYEHFMKILSDHGIEPIDAEGKPFDPHVHEALMQQPSSEREPGTVLKQVARGYRMHDRVLRPTRVIVAAQNG